MARTKTKSVFICQECGYRSAGWLGRCPDCSSWNSLIEETEGPVSANEQVREAYRISADTEPSPIGGIKADQAGRMETGIAEFDRILGGGVVPGSVVLIGGDPGIGKSTLLLQAADRMSRKTRVLYISGEESLGQTKLRAQRLGDMSDELYILSETNLDSILAQIKKFSPDIVVVDSIQVLYREDLSSSPGSVSQVRACAQELTFTAKRENVTIFIVGHVTKDGSIAGPRVLEHMVDTVLYFEGDDNTSYRILRAVKNRFGSTQEIGIFEMSSAGLNEVTNPSGIFLDQRPRDISGSVVVPTIEGTRTILVEIQSLVTPTNFGMPRREARGVDYNRVSLLTAVLERRVGLSLGRFDIYVNAAGGIRVTEPAADLGILVAIASNHLDRPACGESVVMGEVGLGGEIRSVNRIETRLKECARIGFKRAFRPKRNMDQLVEKPALEIVPVSFVREAVGLVLKK